MPDNDIPHLSIVENEETHGGWAFEKLSQWIEQHPGEMPDEELRDWFESHAALHRSEVDGWGETEEFAVFDGEGVVYFGYSRVLDENSVAQPSEYTLRRFKLVDELGGD